MIMRLISFFLVIAFCSMTWSLTPRLAVQRGVQLQRSRVQSVQLLGQPSTTSISSSVESADVIRIDSSISPLSKLSNRVKLLYKFCRPHTIKGTILASCMGVTRALLENPGRINVQLIPRALVGLTALLCGNAFIVGINQIYDVKIDEVNKPFLPIAAKTMSENTAWIVVLTCLALGVSIVKTMFSAQIFNLYSLGVVLGTIYSVPPVQLKRFPLFAGSIIAVVRGFLLNFGVYYAVREAIQVPFRWNPVVVFISSFMTIFASVIAVTKDLPDIEGDRQYQITTLASQFGVKPIATAAAVVLSLAYLAAMAVPFVVPGVFRKLPMVLGHGIYLIYFLSAYRNLDAASMDSVKRFYKSIWDLFYLEYLLYPFI